MSGLQITITTAGKAAIVNAENTGTAPVRIARIGVTAQAFAPNAGMLALPGEIKRLDTFAGEAVADDTLHLTIGDDSADTYSLRGFGLYLSDGTLFAVYGQSAVILEKSPLATMLLATDVRFVEITATSLEFGDTTWINPPATVSTPGVVELADNAETTTGTDGTRAVTPAGLKAAIDDRFGAGAPSAFVKGLLALTTAALVRAAIGLGNAALRNEGANNGLDADKLDGQHGAYYLDWANLTGKPATFAPSAHRHAWSDLDNVPATASRWPAWLDVTDKPAQFPPTAHTHAAADVTSGVFDPARIPDLGMAKVTGLIAALAAKAGFGENQFVAKQIVEMTPPAIDGGAYNNGNMELRAPNGRHPRIGFHIVGNDAAALYYTGGVNFSAINSGGINCNFWHSQNFDPASKLNKAGDTMTGGLIVPYLTVQASGGGTEGGEILIAGAPGYSNTVLDSVGHSTRIFGGASNPLDFNRNTGTLTVPGPCAASGGFDFGSSRKLKDIDGAMPYGLAEVRRIVTLVGRYKSGFNNDGRRRLFFDAEQFMGVMPEVVDPEGVEFNGERVPSIKLDQVMPPAYRAIAELADLVDALRAEVAALKAAR